MNFERFGLSAVSLVALMAPALASAQEMSDPVVRSGGIEDIVVTAQKREQNLQDVPVAVSAVTSSALEGAAITEITDLTVVVPTLTIQNTNGYLTGSIRGIGSNSVGAGVENQVALYVDDVYIGSPAASLLNFNNVEQVAVLKGPQGTLFGRNATAGVIQVTTREPTHELSGNFRISYGNYEEINADAYISGGLSDTLAADLSVYYRTQGEGYGINRFTGADINQIKHDVGVRSKIVFEPSDSTKFTLIGDYVDRIDTGTQVYSIGRRNPFGVDPTVPQPDIGRDGNFDGGPAGHDNWAGGGSLKWEQEIGGLKFLSLTAYRESVTNFNFDFDRGPLPVINIFVRQPDRQFSQELQLQSGPGSAFQLVVGAFYYSSKSAFDDFRLEIPGVQEIFVSNFQEAESYAAFAQGSYEILDNTTLTLGARYTKETKREVDATTTIVDTPTGAVVAVLNDPNRSLKVSKPTFRASLDHRFSDAFMAYVSFNTGFKSGGFNTGAPGTAPYTPEKLTTYEAGVKMDLLDRRLRFNVAGFYNDYKNIQISKLVATPNGGTSIGVENAASAEIYGLEADLTAQITDDLRFSSGVMWISPEFTSFPDCDIIPPGGGIPASPGSCGGNQIPLAPEFTINAALDYGFELANGSELNFNGNVFHTAKFYFDVANNYPQKAYTLFNGSIAWTDASDRLTVRLYGRNLSNKRYVTYQGLSADSGAIADLYAPPRTYGIRLETRY